MNLLKFETLSELKKFGFPQPEKLLNWQTWYCPWHQSFGVFIDGILELENGASICLSSTVDLFYHPTVEDYLHNTPDLKIEMWDGKPSARIDNDAYPIRFSLPSLLESCALSYLYTKRIPLSHE